MVSANHTLSNLAQVAKMTANMTCDQVNTSKEKMDNDRLQLISLTAVLLMTTVTSSFILVTCVFTEMEALRRKVGSHHC